LYPLSQGDKKVASLDLMIRKRKKFGSVPNCFTRLIIYRSCIEKCVICKITDLTFGSVAIVVFRYVVMGDFPAQTVTILLASRFERSRQQI